MKRDTITRVFAAGTGRIPILVALIAGMALASCSPDRTRLTPLEDLTVEELVEQGWTSFEQGNATAALTRFDAAILKDATHAPAYTGQGWSRLALAVNTAAFTQALSSFDQAFALGQTGPDVVSGRAASHLGIGDANLASAISEAQNARALAPAFVFAHRTSFNVGDLHLIEAFALADQADWSGALAAADSVVASGIQGGNPGTWIVDGVTYDSFEGAVLAFLHKVSASYAG